MVPVSEQDEQILNIKIKQYSTWFVEIHYNVRNHQCKWLS